MEHVKTELQVYLDYEGKKLKEYSDLLTKYNDLESKRNIHITNNAPKVMKKEKLLELKKNGITSKLDDIELQKIEEDENAEKVRETLLKQIEDKKRRSLDRIESEYRKALLTVENEYQNAKDYCDKQYDMMTNKASRIYKKKKSILEARGQLVSSELDIITEVKSAPEVTIDKQQETLLSQMQLILEGVKSSRRQLVPIKQQDKLTPLPLLPKEPLPTPSKEPLQIPSIPKTDNSISYMTPEELELQEMRNAIKKDIQNREAKEERDRLERKEKQQMEYEAGKQSYEEQLRKMQEEQQENNSSSSNTISSDPEKDQQSEEEKDDIWDTTGMSEHAKASYIKSLLKQGFIPPNNQEEDKPKIISNTKLKKSIKQPLKR